MTTPAVRNLAGGWSLEPVLALSDPRPGWQAPVRTRLREILAEARQEWPRVERIALETRVDELEGELDALLDPPGSSSGRVLFPC